MNFGKGDTKNLYYTILLLGPWEISASFSFKDAEDHMSYSIELYIYNAVMQQFHVICNTKLCYFCSRNLTLLHEVAV